MSLNTRVLHHNTLMHVCVNLHILIRFNYLSSILKRSRYYFLCTKNETSSVLFIQYNMADTTDLSPCSRSVLVTFTYRITKRHPVNISFIKKTSASQSVLPC